MGDPGVINRDPYGEGWLIRVEGSEGLDDLMSAEAYEKLIKEEEGG